MAVRDDWAEDGRIDVGNVADEAEGGGIGGGAGGDEAGVLAAEADGGGSGEVDEGDEGLVNLSDENHLDDVHGDGVSDAEAVVEEGLVAEAEEPGIDLGAAAVDEYGAEADAGEEDEVVDDGGAEVRRRHGGAAVLDDDRLAAEALDEGEGLREDVDAGLGRSRRGGG